MALTDDLKDYITRNCTNTTVIKEKHNVAIVAETHALLKTNISEIRTKATVRLLLELLADVKYKYFANESYSQKGPIRAGVDDYMKSKTLPPVFDPKQTDLDIEEIGKRVLVRRYQPILDFIRGLIQSRRSELASAIQAGVQARQESDRCRAENRK